MSQQLSSSQHRDSPKHNDPLRQSHGSEHQALHKQKRCNCFTHQRRYERELERERLARENSQEPPSTPARPAWNRGMSAKQPSTTPTAAPPSGYTSQSFTPAGQPPFRRSESYGGHGSTGLRSSTNHPFGSPSPAARGRTSPAFRGGRTSPATGQRGRHSPSIFSGNRSTRIPTPTRALSERGGYRVPFGSSPPGSHAIEDDDDDHHHDGHDGDLDGPVGAKYNHLRKESVEDAIMEEDPRDIGRDEFDHHDHDHHHDHDDLMDDDLGFRPSSRPTSRPESPPKFDVTYPNLSPTRPRSRASTMGSPVRSPVRSPAKSRLGKSQHKLDIANVAKSIASAARHASLTEDDEFILATERILIKLGESDGTDEDLCKASEALQTIWDRDYEPYQDFIGPGENADPIAKADFVTSLVLQLHHPPPFNPQSQFNSKSGRRLANLASSVVRSFEPGSETAIPKTLVDWLDERHDPSHDDYEALKALRGDYSSSPQFWEMLFACVIRGKFLDASEFLQGANFAVAYTAVGDGYAEPGYHGMHLQNTITVAQHALAVLEACPAFRDDNWDVKGYEWMLYRHTVEQAIDDLKYFSEEGRAEEEDLGFSRGSEAFSYSTASRRAESKVPFEVYESFLIFYDLLLGKPEEIIETSYDWLEATICLTAWWDGEEEEEAVTKDSLKRARKAQQARSVDLTPKQAYRKRLRRSLTRVLAEAENANADDKGLSINSNNPVEIALACVCEDNMEGLIGILRGWSMTMTNAIVEVAGTGQWLGDLSSPSDNLMSGFDKSDLMVLSFGHNEKQGLKKDDILQEYADMLFAKTRIGKAEGWELAIQVLGRMDRADNANRKISEVLDRLPLVSTERVDKILGICNSLALNELANTTAERYASSLAESSHDYGSALFYYARAHNAPKIRDVLDLLISLCLIHSTAYPAAADLDTHLSSLLSAPKQALSQLARTDLDAAQLLSTSLSGYATLRAFYDLRDSTVAAEASGRKRAVRPLKAKRMAAAALMALISSAADCIRGGLYDPDVENVIQIDGLLTLLGEALVFVDRHPRVLKSDDLATLLRVVEDLQAAPSLVYRQCEEHLAAALGAAHDRRGVVEPPRALRKSVHGLGGQNLGASVFGLGESGVLVGRDSAEGSAVLEKDVRRGWDWRRGLGKDGSGEEVCRILRVGLAREVGRGWVESEE